MSLAKVLVYAVTEADCALLCNHLTDAGWDAEAVTAAPQFAKALQWWRPDVVLLSADGGGDDLVRMVGGGVATNAHVPFIIFGARPKVSLDRSAALLGVRTVRSVIDCVTPLVEDARAVYDVAHAKDKDQAS